MSTQLLLTIAGMMVVTYLPRCIPLLALAGRRLPSLVVTWLSFVPAAVLGALLCASLSAEPGSPSWAGFSPINLLATLPAGAVAFRTKSILATVAVGVVVVAVSRAWL